MKRAHEVNSFNPRDSAGVRGRYSVQVAAAPCRH